MQLLADSGQPLGASRLARAAATRPQAGRAEVVRAEDIFEY